MFAHHRTARWQPAAMHAMGGPGGEPPFGAPFGGPRFGGPPFGGPGFGGPGFGGPPLRGGRGRKRRGDVRIALLLLLAEEPRNGYQLMQTIEERSGGRWRPSPGSVYPALAQLEDEGFVRQAQRDGARVFEITDAGREHVEARETTAPPWEAGDGPDVSTFHDLRSLIIGIGKAGWQVAQEGNQQHWAQASQILSEARRSLYGILAEEPEAPKDDTPDGTDA
jgi:DNA-binding PadR family transcriptional regulator